MLPNRPLVDHCCSPQLFFSQLLIELHHLTNGWWNVYVSLLVSASERADPRYCRDRLTEGSNINKSLVTLGIVISALGK